VLQAYVTFTAFIFDYFTAQLNILDSTNMIHLKLIGTNTSFLMGFKNDAIYIILLCFVCLGVIFFRKIFFRKIFFAFFFFVFGVIENNFDLIKVHLVLKSNFHF
jgi:uncharacterized membrane protein